MIDFGIGKLGLLLVDIFYSSADNAMVLGMNLNNLTLSSVLGAIFFYPAVIMGVPIQDAAAVGGLMGTKMVANEFVAYSQMIPMIDEVGLQPKSILIATFALCGFANFGSIAILIGGVGGMVPDRKHDLAKLGMRAMICGTLASYLSASIAGIMHVEVSADSGSSLFGPVLIMLTAFLVILFYNLKDNNAVSDFMNRILARAK